MIRLAPVGAFILLLWGTYRHQLSNRVWKDISCSLFPFVIGLFIVIRGVENIGLAKIASQMLSATGQFPFFQLPIIASATALGSNLINNIPMALLAVSALKHANSDIVSQYAALIGCNLSPNLTITGSLATMLVITSVREAR